MSKPIVAVIGRPNVGKSTLFNKLIRKRVAITQDDPGVTRDRLYQEAEWQNKYFTIVDTGGIEPENEELIPQEILNQAQLAIDTADVILFIVDGRAGVNNTDREVAHFLRRTNKPVILAVNKIDNRSLKDEYYEFYELGFDNIVSISAENSLGLGDLLDDIVANFPDDAYTESDDDITKVAIVGKPNVGKSSLINRVLGEKRMIVTDIAGTTRDAIDSKVEYKDHEYILIDTAGLRRKRAIKEDVERYSVVRTLAAMDRADICVLVIDAEEGVSEQDTKIIGYAHDAGKGIIIAVNKWDLIKKETNTMRDFEDEIRQKLGFVNYAPVLFMSVKNNVRVSNLFDLLELVSNNYATRISTGVFNNVISDAVLRTPTPTDKGVSLKIYYASQVATKPPKFLLSINKRELMHFSYQRYLENQIRDKFGFVGVPLQFEYRVRGE